MFASASLSSPKAFQPSYADRAKQATNQTTSLRPNAIVATAYSSNRLSGSSGSTRDPGVEDSYPPLSASGSNFDRKPQEKSRSSSPPSANAAMADPASSNTSINETSTNAAGQIDSTKLPPAANVWQTRSSQVPTVHTRTPLASSSQKQVSEPRLKVIPAEETVLGTSRSTNGVPSPHLSEKALPFTLRSHAPVFLPADDKESWPEVSTLSRPAMRVNGQGSKDGSEKAERDSTRKGGVILYII